MPELRHAGAGPCCRRASTLPSRRRPVAPPAASYKGFGPAPGGPKSDRDGLQDRVKQARTQQLATGDLLAKLLQADNPAAVAAQYVESLTEEFFHAGGAYVAMAEKEGNTEVVARLRAAMQAAMQAKQATLRPEIQLLNSLLAAPGAVERKQILDRPESQERLAMNDRYFFGLLDRFTADVGRQPAGAQQAELATKLGDIRSEALARLPAGQ